MLKDEPTLIKLTDNHDTHAIELAFDLPRESKQFEMVYTLWGAMSKDQRKREAAKLLDWEAADKSHSAILWRGAYGDLKSAIKQARKNKLAFDAVEKGDLAAFKKAVSLYTMRGANIDAVTVDGDSFLSYAIKMGKQDIIQYLVTKHSRLITQVDKDGNTPLHIAALMGDDKTVALLIGKNADINARNNEGETPLHTAARLGKLDTAIELAKMGANVAVTDKEGNTPLLSVLYSQDYLGKEELMRHLIKQDYTNLPPVLKQFQWHALQRWAEGHPNRQEMLKTTLTSLNPEKTQDGNAVSMTKQIAKSAQRVQKPNQGRVVTPGKDFANR